MEDDVALVLGKKGLKLIGRDGKTTFSQPCACFDGRSCTIYRDRPIRCQRFECHTLKQALNHKIGHSEALARIRSAKREAETVRRLLRSLGQTDEDLALTKRYQAVMSQPIDLSAGDDAAEKRGELMLAVNDLMARLHRDFLK